MRPDIPGVQLWRIRWRLASRHYWVKCRLRVAQQPPASVPVGELAKLTDIVAPLVDANGQPANPPLSDLATAIANPGTIEPPAPAAVDPTGGPIAEPAPVAPQDPSAPTNG